MELDKDVDEKVCVINQEDNLYIFTKKLFRMQQKLSYIYKKYKDVKNIVDEQSEEFKSQLKRRAVVFEDGWYYYFLPDEDKVSYTVYRNKTDDSNELLSDFNFDGLENAEFEDEDRSESSKRLESLLGKVEDSEIKKAIYERMDKSKGKCKSE